MSPRTLAATLAALLLTAASACRDVGPSTVDLLQDIQRHRAVWEARRPAAYAFNLQRTCRCTDEGRGPVRVRVQGKTVIERTYTASGNPVPSTFESVFPSVEGLFDLLEAAARRDVWYMSITWDSELAFPWVIYVDFDAKVADDELSYQILVGPAPDRGKLTSPDVFIPQGAASIFFSRHPAGSPDRGPIPFRSPT